MRTLIILANAGLLMAAPLAAQARNGGASQSAPGTQYHNNGPVSGTNGASGYAPGQQYRMNGETNGQNGASGYAPGRNR